MEPRKGSPEASRQLATESGGSVHYLLTLEFVAKFGA